MPVNHKVPTPAMFHHPPSESDWELEESQSFIRQVASVIGNSVKDAIQQQSQAIVLASFSNFFFNILLPVIERVPNPWLRNRLLLLLQTTSNSQGNTQALMSIHHAVAKLVEEMKAMRTHQGSNGEALAEVAAVIQILSARSERGQQTRVTRQRRWWAPRNLTNTLISAGITTTVSLCQSLFWRSYSRAGTL